MGFEDDGDAKVLEMRIAIRHKRSKSFPEKRGVDDNDSLGESTRLKLDTERLKMASESDNKRCSPRFETRNSLKREIMQLEKKLQEQFLVRRTLEKALGSTASSSSSYNASDETSLPKPAMELIKEIAVLELEVVQLEQYLLSLYRKAFDQQMSAVSPPNKDETEAANKSVTMTPKRLFVNDSAVDTTTSTAEAKSKLLSPVSDATDLREHPNNFSLTVEDDKVDSGVHRCYSTLSNQSGYPTRSMPALDSVERAFLTCHSQPLSMMEHIHNNTSSNVISLAEHLGTRISDHIPDTPNRISEEMVKTMASIFCKLADPPSSSIHNSLSSPNSSSTSSPRYRCDTWSPSREYSSSSFEVKLDNPFNVEGLKEFSGPYSTMVEVGCIYRENQKLGDVDHLLQNFKSLISRLQEIDPKKMERHEKLAFWINVHNALIMHAFLAYGIPQSNMKRVFLLLKAAYNVGGHTISADTIQSTVLGCRMSRPGQWIRRIISPKTKFKARDERQGYSIDHPEPLLHYALCSGSHSDPALRVYTPKRLYHELESAKDEYIRATFGVRKVDQKLQLPKMVESYAKEIGINPSNTAMILDLIQQSLPDSLRKTVKRSQQVAIGRSKHGKGIEWISHNFNFRYLISKELVNQVN